MSHTRKKKKRKKKTKGGGGRGGGGGAAEAEAAEAEAGAVVPGTPPPLPDARPDSCASICRPPISKHTRRELIPLWHETHMLKSSLPPSRHKPPQPNWECDPLSARRAGRPNIFVATFSENRANAFPTPKTYAYAILCAPDFLSVSIPYRRTKKRTFFEKRAPFW